MNPFIAHLSQVLLRDLGKLEKEISMYADEHLIWTVKGEIINPAGNLCLHLCGNLQYYIGAILGNTGYVRNREQEFSKKNVPAKELLSEISNTKNVIQNVLPKLDTGTLEKEYPIVVFDGPMNTQYFLLHLAGHLNYHLGQVNYHRRMIQA